MTVYGVAMAAQTVTMESFPYLWVYMLRDRRVDSTTLCYAIDDTATAELYCFIDRQPVSYADFGFVPTDPGQAHDTFTIPCYEFYFRHPVQVQAGQRFYVGISHSAYNVYNHQYKDQPYCPWAQSYIGVRFFSWNTGRSQDPGCMGDGLDSTWSLRKYITPGVIDWACGTCRTPPVDPEAPYDNKYSSYGFFPIIRPPEDSTRIFAPHEQPLRAGAVEGFRLTGLDTAMAEFAWDTVPASDWGPVGVNAIAYEVNYAPYMEEYDEADTVMSAEGRCTLRMRMDSTVMYKARCRAQSYHTCDIHNELVWGDWSDEVYFHTGVGVPDTVPLECRRVEGFRYGWEPGALPKFEWERCEGQDSYELQYAERGGAWRNAGSTTQTELFLLEELDTTARYWMRIRARCHHRCHIHDTVMDGEWDTLEFTCRPEMEGVGAVGVEAGFELQPNPSGRVVTVTLPEAARRGTVLRMADASGREVHRKELPRQTRTYTFRVSDYPAGTYFVTLTTPAGSTTQKLVVE